MDPFTGQAAIEDESLAAHLATPAAPAVAPHQVVQFAAGIADAMSVEQDKRNPDRFESNRY